MMPLVFWQNIPSIHQAPLLRAVAHRWDCEVLVVTEADVPSHRLRQGWQRPDYSPCRLILAPSRQERERLVIEKATQGAVHIFSGLNAYPETYWTLKQVSRTLATLGVFMEPGRTNDGFRAVLRRIHYRLQGLQWGRRLDFILATGEQGVQWYCRRGFPKNNIHPFGYFVEHQPKATDEASIRSNQQQAADQFHLLFVGQLYDGKGLDLLLGALHSMSHQPWRLDVVGEGPEGNRYKLMAKQLAIDERVQWHGAMANHEVIARMAHTDALVLPSRYDGWGAVVNEALMAGTRVIVSNACGSADLVQENWRGLIFEAGSLNSLRRALITVIEMGRCSQALRTRILTWARKAIAPETAACYLLEIIEYIQHRGRRPLAPWCLECAQAIASGKDNGK